jgi:hypothetical protein
MIPTDFPESNHLIGPPPGVDESQVGSIPAHIGEFGPGPNDGEKFVVVAWQPSFEDIIRIADGGKIYLSMMSGLLPHRLFTDVNEIKGQEGK